MNNAIAKHAPKTKTYSRTMSLQNRVSLAIGLTNDGYEKHMTALFSSYKMAFPQRMSQTYNRVDKDIEKRKARQKMNSQKQKRAEMKTKKTLDEIQKACNDKKTISLMAEPLV